MRLSLLKCEGKTKADACDLTVGHGVSQQGWGEISPLGGLCVKWSFCFRVHETLIAFNVRLLVYLLLLFNLPTLPKSLPQKTSDTFDKVQVEGRASIREK